MQESVHNRAPTGFHHSSVEARVRIGPLMGIPGLLQEFGRESGPVFASVGLDTTRFNDPDTRIPYLVADRLLARCVAETGCGHFGLLTGMRASPSSLGIAGFMLRSAPDVGSALRLLVQYLDLQDQGGVATLHMSGNETRLGYAIHLSGVLAADQIYDLSIALACNIMRGLCGEAWRPAGVLLSHRPPRDLLPYRHFFRAPLSFNADQCAVVFPTRWLNHRNPNADALLHRYLEQEAVDLHKHRKTDFTRHLRELLRKSLASGKCTAVEVACQLHMHERTLNRRLHEAGTSFHHELDDIRYQMACELLAGSTMPVFKIAKALSYTDASAFSRAFKRWAGISPAQWRARHSPA